MQQQLKKCVRVLPHLQNTGGFFVALLEKVESLPWESKRERVFEEREKKEEPPTKKKRFWGFKEDPFIYCKEGDEAVSKKNEASPNNLAPVKFKKYFFETFY